jgi:hypothetical protein
MRFLVVGGGFWGLEGSIGVQLQKLGSQIKAKSSEICNQAKNGTLFHLAETPIIIKFIID